jgi:nitroimidazol reductase NimA-like FMN-containing flavoprotein (pyridoxamine 5'-phosphate oxidase superfamily)
MPKMTQEEIEEFLTAPGFFARLGTLDADGHPRVHPISFLYRDGKINFTLRPSPSSQDNVRRDPRIALSIDEREQPMRRVIIQGVARIVYEAGEDHKWKDEFREMLLKTDTPEYVEEYLQGHDDLGVHRPWFEVDLNAPTTRMKTWRNPIEEQPGSLRPSDGGRPMPFAKQYIPGWSGSDSTSETT